MKRILFIVLTVCMASSAFAHLPVNEKVLKSFNEAFPNVKNELWSEYDNFYEVYFDTGDVKCRMYYDFNGNVLRTRRDYCEPGLCPFIKAKVTQKFPGKKIFGVTEITSADEMFYLVMLEDNKSWTQVRVDATGQMFVTEKLIKSGK